MNNSLCNELKMIYGLTSERAFLLAGDKEVSTMHFLYLAKEISESISNSKKEKDTANTLRRC